MTESLERVRAALRGQYEIERELGRGSMAWVYAARERETGRPVALKVLFPELTETVGAERFEREIRIGSRLSHAHIVPIYKSGRANGFLYFAMPLLEGESLAQRLDRERQLPLDEALEVTRQVAAALEHAHQHGVIHRDIKPQNIMLTPGGAVMMDFGIAALLQAIEPDRLTEAGLAMGTPDYMSPEQATGDGDLDGRSDVYSLACVLYEMLAGHPPFQGASVQTVLARHARDPVPRLGSVRLGISTPVESVVVRAMAKLPADRFSSPAELAAALEMAEQGVTPRGVTPLGSPGPSATWGGPGASKGAPAAWRLATALAVAVVILGLATELGRRPAAEVDGFDLASVLPRPGPEAARDVERCAWGIAPLRVAGAHPDVAALSANLSDRLGRALNGSTVGPGVLRAGSDSVSAARAEALDRRFRRLVTGAVVGSPDRVTLQAASMGTRTGQTLGQANVEGPLDSLPALAARLALQLAIPTMDASTRAHLAHTPLAAIDAVLEGIAAQCRADDMEWVGAARQFELALRIDSTFALAALLLSDVGWGFPNQTVQYDFEAARERAWELRSRLPAADRLRLELERRPEWRYATDRIALLRDGVARFPNSSWFHRELGAALFYSGEYVGIEDWAEGTLRSQRAMAELLDLPGGVNCMELNVLGRLPGIRREEFEPYRHCRSPLELASRSGDTARVRRLREAGETMNMGPGGFPYWGVQQALDLTDWQASLDQQRADARTVPERLRSAMQRLRHEVIRGHPEAAARLADSAAASATVLDYPNLPNEFTPWSVLATALTGATYEPGGESQVPALVRRMYSFPDTAVYDPNGGSNSSFDRLCPSELARVVHGDTSSAARAIESLVAWRERELMGGPRACPEMIAALLERARLGGGYAAAPAPALARLDSAMAPGPLFDANHNNGGLVLARLYWDRADLVKAREWIARRRYSFTTALTMAAWLRLDARISVAVGDSSRALRMYRHYLLLRDDPEPGPPTAQRDSVIQELACIDDAFVDARDPDCSAVFGNGP